MCIDNRFYQLEKPGLVKSEEHVMYGVLKILSERKLFQGNMKIYLTSLNLSENNSNKKTALLMAEKSFFIKYIKF